MHFAAGTHETWPGLLLVSRSALWCLRVLRSSCTPPACTASWGRPVCLTRVLLVRRQEATGEAAFAHVLAHAAAAAGILIEFEILAKVHVGRDRSPAEPIPPPLTLSAVASSQITALCYCSVAVAAHRLSFRRPAKLFLWSESRMSSISDPRPAGGPRRKTAAAGAAGAGGSLCTALKFAGGPRHWTKTIAM